MSKILDRVLPNSSQAKTTAEINLLTRVTQKKNRLKLWPQRNLQPSSAQHRPTDNQDNSQLCCPVTQWLQIT